MDRHTPETRWAVEQTVWPSLLASLLALALYVSTAAPGLTWAHDGADGGDLIAAATNWGIPHPSGYPTYTILGHFVGLVPFGSVARRFNLFSAVAAAGSVFWIGLTSQKLRSLAARPHLTDHLVTFAIALTWGTTWTFWSQAIITEVYALLSFFFAWLLYLVISTEQPCGWHRAALIGLVAGLGLGTHLTLILTFPGLLLLLWPALSGKGGVACSLGLLLGISVYAYLPLAAEQRPLVNWGNPTNWSRFWWMISGRLYQSYAFALPLRFLPNRLGAALALWARQCSALGVGLAIFGLESWLNHGNKRLALATGMMAALIGIYALTYNTTDSYVYLLPAFAISMLWLREGLDQATRMLKDAVKALSTKAAWATTIVLLAIPIWSVWAHYDTLSLGSEGEALQWLEQVERMPPPNALLISGQDRHTFALDYLLWVEGRRTDLVIIDADLYGLDWYQQQLTQRYPHAHLPSNTSLTELISEQIDHRPVLLADPQPDIEADFAVVQQGVFWTVTAWPDTSAAIEHMLRQPHPATLRQHTHLPAGPDPLLSQEDQLLPAPSL